MLKRWAASLAVVVVAALVVVVNLHYLRTAGRPLEVRFSREGADIVLTCEPLPAPPTLEVVLTPSEAVYRLRWPAGSRYRLAARPVLPLGTLALVSDAAGQSLEYRTPTRLSTCLEFEAPTMKFRLRGGVARTATVRVASVPPIGRVFDEAVVQGQVVSRPTDLPLGGPAPGSLDGLPWRVDERVTEDGRRWAVACQVPRAAVGRLRVVLAQDRLGHGAPLRELAASAVLAVNGGFFDPSSLFPLGALRLGSEWVSPPLLGRTCLVLGPDGPRLERLQWTASLGDGRRLTAFNHSPGSDDACALTTSRWPEAAFGGFQRQSLQAGLTLHERRPTGKRPTVALTTEPAVVGSVLGGGPRLVHAGQVAVEAAAEHFRPDVSESVTARSGVGITADGALWLASAPARVPYTVGWSLSAWAEYLRDLGCVEAMNLDGGASAALVAGGQVLGPPGVAREVLLPTALVVQRR